jgi:hypothetical protein
VSPREQIERIRNVAERALPTLPDTLEDTPGTLTQ